MKASERKIFALLLLGSMGLLWTWVATSCSKAGPSLCSQDSDCQEANGCDLGICHPICQTSTDCPGDQVCVWISSSGFCRKACLNSSDCQGEELCQGGSCTPQPPSPTEERDAGDAPWDHDTTDSHDGGDEGTNVQDEGAATDESAAGCVGTYAYLHGDLWPMWYNFRMCCDAEHRAAWRCERIHGAGSANCDALKSHYQECLNSPNSSVCPNWGVCCFKGSNGCTDPDAEHATVCNTQTVDYDSDEIWGHYYRYHWASHTDWHRMMTVKIWNQSDELIIAYSSNPGSADANMDGISNHGIGADPQGYIQEIQNTYDDPFGTFACIRLPANEPLNLQAYWINEFAHTCKDNYWSYPNTPCWTDKIQMTFEPGRHYLWTEKGLVRLDGCSGPPAQISKWLPQATCSTTSP